MLPCHRVLRHVRRGAALWATVSMAMLPARPAQADPGLQIAASAGLGAFAVGAGQQRFAIVPTASILLFRRQPWVLRLDDAATLLGATGGRFGLANATTISIGARWEDTFFSAGLSFDQYLLPLCGVRTCADVRGLAPGLDTRLDVFIHGVLRDAAGVSASCGTIWIVGQASVVWSGFATRCSLGPIFRLTYL